MMGRVSDVGEGFLSLAPAIRMPVEALIHVIVERLVEYVGDSASNEEPTEILVVEDAFHFFAKLRPKRTPVIVKAERSTARRIGRHQFAVPVG